MAYRLISPPLIALNLGVRELDFCDEVRTIGTPSRQAFYKGYLRQLIETRDSIIRMARNGSNPAIEQLLDLIHQLKYTLAYE